MDELLDRLDRGDGFELPRRSRFDQATARVAQRMLGALRVTGVTVVSSSRR
jgi:hypothetical protein